MTRLVEGSATKANYLRHLILAILIAVMVSCAVLAFVWEAPACLIDHEILSKYGKSYQNYSATAIIDFVPNSYCSDNIPIPTRLIQAVKWDTSFCSGSIAVRTYFFNDGGGCGRPGLVMYGPTLQIFVRNPIKDNTGEP